MSLSFYADEHVSTAECDGLAARGVDILRAVDDGMRSAPDPDILDRATNLGRVVFTHDTDFLAMATSRQERGEYFGGVAYCHVFRLPIGKLIEALEILSESKEPADAMNTIIYLPLGK